MIGLFTDHVFIRLINQKDIILISSHSNSSYAHSPALDFGRRAVGVLSLVFFGIAHANTANDGLSDQSRQMPTRQILTTSSQEQPITTQYNHLQTTAQTSNHQVNQQAKASTSPINIDIHALAARHGIAVANISLMITRLGDAYAHRAPIVSHLTDTPRTPASVQKLITTAIGLEQLGADFRWQTRIYTHGAVIAGTLYGDLVLVGAGDPSVTHQDLATLFDKLAARGIRHIKGGIIIDNSLFQRVNYDPNAFDQQGIRAYNAAPAALLVNFGTLQIDITPAQDGHRLKVSPDLADFDRPATITTNGGRCQALKPVDFVLNQTSLTPKRGRSVACGAEVVWLNFGDNDVLASKSVLAAWRRHEPNYRGAVRVWHSPIRARGLPIVTLTSKSLTQIITDINHHSNNVMTEMLALSLPIYSAGAQAQGLRHSDYPKTFEHIGAWWQSHLVTPSPVMSRASGLCRDCRLSVRNLNELLAKMHRSPQFESFLASLPLAGHSGTMKTLAQRQPHNRALGRAHIKTGRLNDVASISGYVQANSGWYAVSAIINEPNAGNNTHATALLDDILDQAAQLP